MSSILKVTVFLAISINGMVADKDDQVPWEEPIWDEYFKLVKGSGALIVGRPTLELMATTDEIEKLNSVKIAVLTRNIHPPKDNLSFSSEPEQIIEDFQRQGFENVIIGGGPQTNSLFLRKNLVNEVVSDTFPIIMPSTGKLLFSSIADDILPRKMKPTRTRTLGNGCTRVHYDFV